MRNELSVLTPEKVEVSYRLGNVGSRILAHLADLLVAGAAMVALSNLLSRFLTLLDPALAQVAVGFLTTFGLFAYFILFEGLWNGQTPGKWMLKLRVRMADGTPVTFPAAAYRNLMRPADFLPTFYLAGIGAMFLNEKSQRLGDLAAGTVVVHQTTALPVFAAAPHRFGLHPFEDAVGELRGMTVEEYQAVKRLCDRFPELPPRVQEQWLRDLWEPFARRHGIPALPNVHPVYLMEAAVMRYGRQRGLL